LPMEESKNAKRKPENHWCKSVVWGFTLILLVGVVGWLSQVPMAVRYREADQPAYAGRPSSPPPVGGS